MQTAAIAMQRSAQCFYSSAGRSVGDTVYSTLRKTNQLDTTVVRARTTVSFEPLQASFQKHRKFLVMGPFAAESHFTMPSNLDLRFPYPEAGDDPRKRHHHQLTLEGNVFRYRIVLVWIVTDR